jgi:hypothetical protein
LQWHSIKWSWMMVDAVTVLSVPLCMK